MEKKNTIGIFVSNTEILKWARIGSEYLKREQSKESEEKKYI